MVKGWKKTGSGKVLYWMKEASRFGEDDEVIDITPELYPVGLRWNVNIYKKGGIGRRNDIESKTFKTKTLATEYAIKWMKKYPKK